jgi:hypothetical protein
MKSVYACLKHFIVVKSDSSVVTLLTCALKHRIGLLIGEPDLMDEVSRGFQCLYERQDFAFNRSQLFEFRNF